MSADFHQIDTEACKGDGICVEICPENVFELVDDKARCVETRMEDCIMCGQCITVCPSDAIKITDLPSELFEKIEKWTFEPGEFHTLLNARRSVRNFKDKPVDRDLIDQIIQTASTAPMGFPPHTTEIMVIDDPGELNQLLKNTVEDYKGLVFAASNPLIRPFIRMTVGAEIFNELKQHVIPVAKNGIEAFEKNGADQFSRNAPVLMLFHANRWSTSYRENGYLACTYSMLAAHSHGLGTTIIGMIPPIVDRSKALRKRYGIPKDNKVITSLILGHPKYKYRKTVKREFPSVKFFESVEKNK